MKKIVLAFIFIFFVGVPAPVLVSAQTTDEAYRAVLVELISQLQKQIELLQTELDRRQQVEVVFDAGAGLSGSVDVIATYSLTSPSDIHKIEDLTHRAYFARMFELFPSEYDDVIRYAVVFGGDKVNFDAYVETLPPRHEYWLYAAHEDLMEEVNSLSNAELIIHELAHVVSYKEIVGVPKPGVTRCHEYFGTQGCPAKNSYLSEFVSKFWSGTDLERAEDFANSASMYEDAYTYYDDNESQYVSDYAAISPEEDFSESFLYYILDEAVTGMKAKEKKEFFDNYPHIRQVRYDIQSRL